MASYLETMAAQHAEMERQRVLSQKYREADAARRAEETRGFRAAIEARWAAEAERLRKADEARMSADKAAGAALIAKKQAESERRQAQQWEWAARRDALQADVASIRGLLGGASGLMVSGAIEEARTAAADVAIYTRRLAAAELQLAVHVRAQPRFLG